MLLDNLNIYTEFYTLYDDELLTISYIINENRILFGYSLRDKSSYSTYQNERRLSKYMLNNFPHLIIKDDNVFLKTDSLITLKIIQFIIIYLKSNSDNIQYEKYVKNLVLFEKTYREKLIQNITETLRINYVN